jgi:ammonia channel protein AmtB
MVVDFDFVALVVTRCGGDIGGALTWMLLGRALERRWHARELILGALAGVSSVAAGVGYQVSSRYCARQRY